MAALLCVVLLADPVAEAKTLRDARGVAAFDGIFALAVAAEAGRERQAILDVLVSLGPDAVPSVVAKTQLESPPPRVRECAFMTLQKLAGSDAAAAAIVPLLVHPDSAVRRVVRDALKREWAIPVLLAALRGADAKLRNELRAVLKAQGTALRPHLAALLDDDDAGLRVQLVPLLAAAGDVETISAWTRDPDAGVRWQAVTELGRHVKSPAVVVPALRTALGDRVGRVVLAAVRGLANFPKQADEFVEDVGRLALGSGDDGHIGVAAVRTLLAAGASGRPFVERALQSPDVHIRVRTVQAIGEDGEDMVALIERAAGDASPMVRRVAVEELARWPQAVPTLERALGDREGDVRAAALDALGDLGPKAASAAGTVAKLAGESRHRKAVFETLAAMGPAALPVFLDLVHELPPDRAWEALRLWGAQTTVPALAKLLDAPPASRQRAAAWALGCFGEKAAPAVPALIRLVGDRDRILAGQAIWALGKIGPHAKAALPALKARLDDPALRPLVREALKAIG